jgi:hypothetical protein
VKPEQAKALREPFKPEQIGKLPKAGLMLDYVGHAATTDRLLQVDPEWTWEPMARDEYGCPVISNGGLWIKLTVCGVTRPGWGDGKNVKEMIGDAIRNAAMRFGVALDLWAKEDLRGDDDGQAASAPPRARSSSPGDETQAPAPTNFKVPDAAKAASEARDMTPATDTSKKKLKALAAKLIGEGKATQTQLDSAMIAVAAKSWEPALADPVLPKMIVDDLTLRLSKLDKNAEKAQQEVAA